MVEPPQSHVPVFRTDDTPDGLRVIIPRRPSLSTLLFLVVWLGVWIPAGVYSLTSKAPAMTLGLAVWILFWVVGIVLTVGAILWQLGGREVITVTLDRLTYRAEAFGLGRARVYRLAGIGRLRDAIKETALASTRRHARTMAPWATSHGAVGFDYDGKAVRFAPSLDHAQTAQLLQILRARLPAEAASRQAA